MIVGCVESIHITEAAAQPMIPLAEVCAIEQVGLEGDRYAQGKGTYSSQPGAWSQIALIKAEAVEALAREKGLERPLGEARRNIVTRGVALNHYVDREILVGEARLRGVWICESCDHLARLTHKYALYGLLHRRALRAEIYQGGIILVGGPDSDRRKQTY
jgi:MOSC domain-containing protein YiiM